MVYGPIYHGCQPISIQGSNHPVYNLHFGYFSELTSQCIQLGWLKQPQITVNASKNLLFCPLELWGGDRQPEDSGRSYESGIQQPPQLSVGAQKEPVIRGQEVPQPPQ